MVKVRVWVMTNLVGSKVEDVIEIDLSDLNENEIEEELFDVALQMVEWGFEVVENDDE